MHSSGGVGSVLTIVLCFILLNDKHGLRVILNPRFVTYSRSVHLKEESCLALAGVDHMSTWGIMPSVALKSEPQFGSRSSRAQDGVNSYCFSLESLPHKLIHIGTWEFHGQTLFKSHTLWW